MECWAVVSIWFPEGQRWYLIRRQSKIPYVFTVLWKTAGVLLQYAGLDQFSTVFTSAYLMKQQLITGNTPSKKSSILNTKQFYSFFSFLTPFEQGSLCFLITFSTVNVTIWITYKLEIGFSTQAWIESWNIPLVSDMVRKNSRRSTTSVRQALLLPCYLKILSSTVV